MRCVSFIRSFQRHIMPQNNNGYSFEQRRSVSGGGGGYIDRDGAHHHHSGGGGSTGSSGYGAPSYNAPAASYSPPAASYGAPSASYSSPPSYGGDVVDLTPILIGILVLTGLSLLFPTSVTLTGVRRRRRSTTTDGTQGKTPDPPFLHHKQPSPTLSLHTATTSIRRCTKKQKKRRLLH